MYDDDDDNKMDIDLVNYVKIVLVSLFI